MSESRLLVKIYWNVGIDNTTIDKQKLDCDLLLYCSIAQSLLYFLFHFFSFRAAKIYRAIE